MRKLQILVSSLAFLCRMNSAAQGQELYEANWDSLNKHRAAEWFAESKFGIFIHWGVYSVPAYCDTSTYSEWYWAWVDWNSHNGKERQFHYKNYGEDFKYEDFAPMFRAELWDPGEWADIFVRSGAKYVVLTSKHHDGYCLWPSKEATQARGHAWNSVEVGPGRDLVGELTAAVRNKGLKMGLYYSFMEWHNPIFDRDLPAYVDQVMLPQMKDLINRYEPDVFWPDGEWNHPDTTWRSTEFLAWLFNEGPNRNSITVNDRWGKDLRSYCGDYYTTEYGGGGADATIGTRPFEECRGIGHSFAFNRAEGYDVYMSRTDCVRLLIDLVSKGGVLLLDIGPTADGRIPLLMQDRLFAMGRWLETNGEAIYGTTRSPFRNLSWGRATVNGETLYLHIYDWPENEELVVPPLNNEIRKAYFLADKERRSLKVINKERHSIVRLQGMYPQEHATVVALELDGPPKADPRIYPDADGRFVLDTTLAQIHGPDLRPESSLDEASSHSVQNLGISLPKQNLGYWNNTECFASWSSLTAETDQAYRVDLVFACKKGQEGSMMEIRWGDQVLANQEIPATGEGWHHYQVLYCGNLHAPQEPLPPLEVRASKLAQEAALNLRAVLLTPIPQ